MNPNDNNKSEGLNSTSDLEHIREIEDMLEKRSNSGSGQAHSQAPVRKYVRKHPSTGNAVNSSDNNTSKIKKTNEETPESNDASTIIMNRVDHINSEDGRTNIVPDKQAKADDADIKLASEHISVKNEVAHAKEARKEPSPEKKTVRPVQKADKSEEIVSSRHPAIQKNKNEKKSVAQSNEKGDYTPLLTENDDFEIDENPEPDNVSGGTFGALTSVAKAVIYLVAVLAVSITLAVGIISVANDVFAFVKDDTEVTVVVPENCDTDTLAQLLADSGAIKHPSVFSLYIKFKNMEGEYIPGTYSISPMLNYDYMIYEFKAKSPTRTTVVVTIPEGYSTDQIVALLIEKGLGTYEGYKRAINEYDFDYKFLEDSESFSSDRYWRLDGYLYPDTYYYYSDATEETVIYKMLENFNNKFTEEYYDRADELGMTVDELITLASMIQKEVRYSDEYGNVSSVFHNRLNNPANFPHLDSDATVVYAIEHETGERPDVLKDTSYDSPYNTYKCIGLPPGPIANPSIEAIRYAMYPNDTNYYYFVSGSDGRTVFSRTYSEHIQAIEELY